MLVRIGNLQIRFYITLLENRVGVNSQLYNEPDKHILLWDFDNANIDEIKSSLVAMQLRYRLPEILIVESSPEKYHAYCFASRPFMEVVHILSDTPNVCETFFRIGIIRGYYTLRISTRKGQGGFKLIDRLLSGYKNEVSPFDVTVSNYSTANKGGKKDG